MKNKLIKCFEDTVEFSKSKKLIEKTNKAIDSNKIYYENSTCNTLKVKSGVHGGNIIVEQNTTFNAAKKYAHLGRVAVLNFANPVNPGGGVQNGAMAQEECLCRSSNLYLCLSADNVRDEYYSYHSKKRNHFWSDRLIYTRDVTVFKDDKDISEILPEKEWFDVDVITCAAPYLAKRKYTNSTALLQLFEERIRNIFEAAIDNNVDVLILGAFGCGAFKNSAQVVAEAFNRTIKNYNYSDFFNKIVFAIKPTGELCLNLVAFNDWLTDSSGECQLLESPFEKRFNVVPEFIKNIVQRNNEFKYWLGNNKYFGKQFSILGDSISTLDGYNPRGYNVFYKENNCEKSAVREMSDTWWGKVIDFFGGELLVNNSWSGSRVTKLPSKDSLFPSGCSDERTSALHINNVKPDVIIVYLGTNDWAYGVKTGNDTGILGEDDREKFDFAYRHMIEKLKSNYPDSEILCCTLNKTFMSQKPSFVFPEKHGGIHIDEYNKIIRRIAHDMHCKLIDLYSYNIPYDTIDGSHPNATGMNTLATLMIREIGGEEINKFLDCSAPLENYDNTLMLTVKNTEEKLRCRKNVVRVGRERAYVDICFSNQEISRFQANFIYKNNRWFLCDTKSINGTWLNGKRIEPQKEYELCANDVINFANAIEVIFNEITNLHLYDAKHEFVVADEYTGGTKYVCKKCGKVKYESTLLFDYKILNVHISYDADGNYGKSIDLDGSKLMWRNTMRPGPVTDIDLSEKVKVLNRLELSSLIDKILAVNLDSCVTDASLDYPTGASYNVFTCIYNDGKKFEYKTRFKPTPAFMLLVDIFEKYCVESDVGIQNHTSGTFYNGATVELDADNSTVDNEDCFDLLQPYFVGKVLYERYSVLEQIPSGGFFKIYVVEDIKTNKKLLMKVCDKGQKGYTDNIREIILQEPKMMMKFNHPALPEIFDVIEDDRYILIIRNYFEGESLDIVIRNKGPQSAEKVVEWGKQLCDALSYLHNLTPLHIYRDMKPHNVALTPEGNLKLIDFGTMRMYDPQKSCDTTNLGTKGYAAPEQYGGLGQTDARTDIFGLGMTLCELVTGEDPKKREYVHRPIRQINPDLPKGLEYIISKCTEVDPKNRYQTCSELMDDLNNYMSLPKSKGIFGKFFGK